jgi:diaminopimelate decarboxylase
MATHNLPAAALTDPSLADWARAHGVSVTAHGDRDLDLVRRHRIRPFQVVYRCGPDSAVIRRAVALGVRRFIVGTAHQMARLDECADGTKYLYLDDHAPLMLGDRRLKVVGLHADVGDAAATEAWATAAAGLVRRAAVLQACGAGVKRIALSGGSTALWLDDHRRAAAIADMVDQAVCQECDRSRLTPPAVTFAPLTLGPR